ncbi:MAG: hypothetical protein CMD92_03055 [Gammaproteobacteria bacterium]|nr:hypothetical protein [Gammaproteobacteria bacterium]HBW82784.1 hypothetical protein [Gammaproteobacteria bacterium]|tara:strand:+ start:10821 stop:11264 length:444 start_codon:yes stop_codon:yes gene_type:complete
MKTKHQFCWFTALGLLAVVNLGAQNEEASPLENSSWQLIEMRTSAGAVQRPENPEDYLIRFRLNGRTQITADCNEAGATWSHEGGILRVTELVTTRKLCVAPSLFNFYIMHLQNTVQAELQDQRLTLSTENRRAELIFEPYVFSPSF